MPGYLKSNACAGTSRCRIVTMVGAFPPPVHGMAAVNAAVRELLEKAGVELSIINLAGKNLKRSFIARSSRIPTVIHGLGRLLASRNLRGSALYISISGGFGQFYEICFLILARFCSMRIYLHHHSFAYLDKPNWLTRLLIKISGVSSLHITQSLGMATRLQECYSSELIVVPLSNAVFFLEGCSQRKVPHLAVQTLGFISNISEEKGVFEFLDLIATYEKLGLMLKAKLAGPFQDTSTEKLVRQRISDLSTVDYVGPQFGKDKETFFNSIDVLIFPTRYDNETEGIVNHEAMSRGIPVIAYGRGCISEIVNQASGLVIDPTDEFAPAALSKIKQWLDLPETYQAASQAASECFAKTLDENTRRWEELLSEILGDSSH